MDQEQTEKLFSRTIAQLLEVSEGMFGTGRENKERWEYYRTVLLKRLNELKREVKDELGKSKEGR